ncbi:carbamoyltransferase HypF [Arcobacteraceae bacterium]|nr:carbamoyltransferase HypF [Arcobacteraceae bacterium]
MKRYQYQITGIVQGVGFRPFIFKLANKLGLTGFVFNDSNGVSIELQGDDKSIIFFDKLLFDELPPLAKIDNFVKNEFEVKNSNIFEIKETFDNTSKTTLVSPDIKVCDDCLDDIKKDEKYKNYFAINCTNCGPRYSIIKTIPYDRINTSMDKFLMCDSCAEEYKNPLNRRYHAQPISCNDCGPTLTLSSKNELISNSYDEIYKVATDYIQEGKILAIKGIGGFHIVCDASNDRVVQKLREYKHRPFKPFAIMCKDIQQVQKIVKLSEKEKELLISKESPVIVCDELENSSSTISQYIAPNIKRIGCFLPYTALYHLLFEHLDNPIVATSANLSGEPIITTKEDILKKLPFVDYIVDFNRDIENACDDSVLQIVNDEIQILRAGRGYTPKVIKLKKKISQKILAVGANAKNTISIAFDDTIILSPYIGDLDSLVSFEYFLRTIETFKKFYDFKPDIIVHDKHPNYETTKWAKQQKNVKLIEVQHHLAHIYATKAEFLLEDKKYVGFSFDGTGYGTGGTLWGGEVFVGDERKYHFKAIKLLGGTKAIKEPRRVALSMLFDRYTLDEVLNLKIDTVKSFKESEIRILYNSYSKSLNAPLSSSVGRIFDGVASLAGLLQIQSYEGEAGLLCEKEYKSNSKKFEYDINNGEIEIQYDFFVEDIVTRFLNTLVNIIVDISELEQKEVILSGGVFQNKTLLSKVIEELNKRKIKYFYQQLTPLNDSGISLGQVYYTIMHKI